MSGAPMNGGQRVNDLTLERIRAIGGIVTAKTEPREITWKGRDPETGKRVTYTGTVHVKRMAFGWVERAAADARVIARANGHDEERSTGAMMISGGVAFEGGESLTYLEAYWLDPLLGDALLRAFYDVNSIRHATTTTDDSDTQKDSPGKN